MTNAADLSDPRDAPRLPRVHSPPAEDVLEDVASKDEIVEEAPSRDEVIEDQPGVDEILGRDES